MSLPSGNTYEITVLSLFSPHVQCSCMNPLKEKNRDCFKLKIEFGKKIGKEKRDLLSWLSSNQMLNWKI